MNTQINFDDTRIGNLNVAYSHRYAGLAVRLVMDK